MNIYEMVDHCNSLDYNSLVEYVGSFGIYSKLLIKSKAHYTGDIVATFELDYPRCIHAEVLAHGGLARNAQSSRAVPSNRVLELNDTPFYPVIWGSNQPGMASHTVLSDEDSIVAKEAWDGIFEAVSEGTKKLKEVKLHKQWTNRPLEPFSNIKVVLSGSAAMLENFFWLRVDPDAAQPEIILLALLMKRQYDGFEAMELFPGEWHLPYIDYSCDDVGDLTYSVQGEVVDLETAKKVSAGCCAAVSYRNNPSVEKCLEIWEKLFNGPKPHASPVHHQCTPMELIKFTTLRDNGTNIPEYPETWEKGITHMNQDRSLSSGHFRGFIQFRQILGL